MIQLILPTRLQVVQVVDSPLNLLHLLNLLILGHVNLLASLDLHLLQLLLLPLLKLHLLLIEFLQLDLLQ